MSKAVLWYLSADARGHHFLVFFLDDEHITNGWHDATPVIAPSACTSSSCTSTPWSSPRRKISHYCINNLDETEIRNNHLPPSWSSDPRNMEQKQEGWWRQNDGMILLITEAVWQRHRKLLNPAFTVPVIHKFLGIFNHMSKQFVREIEPHVGKDTFKITPYLRLIAFQTFSSKNIIFCL